MSSTFHSLSGWGRHRGQRGPSARLVLVAAGALTFTLSACGGGSAGEAAKPQSTAMDAAAAAAGATPASGASAPDTGTQASAASAPASGALVAQADAKAADAPATLTREGTPAATTATTPSTSTTPSGNPVAAAAPTPIFGVSTGAGAGAAATSTASNWATNPPETAVMAAVAAPTAPAATAAEPTVSVVPATAPIKSVSSQTCSYEAKATFAANCGALLSAVLSEGESVTFSNTRTGYAGSVSGTCSQGRISWTQASCQATGQGQMQFAMATAATTAPVPDLSKLKVFTARPPFNVETKGGSKRVVLGIYGSGDDVARSHDFVTPLVNPSTNRTSVMTLQTTALVNKVPTFTNISDISTPSAAKADTTGRFGLDAQGNLRMAYLANDPPSGEKLRTQVNSWPIPTRRQLTWDLSVRFAGSGAGETWPHTKFTASPALIWQLKSDPGFPPLGILVDVDPENPTKALQLTFFQRLHNVSAYSRRWIAGGIDPNAFNDIVIQAVPDDRDAVEGGIGSLKVWLNGKLFAEAGGRNLIANLPDVNRWCFGIYLVAEATPSPISRYLTFRRARMLSE